MKAPNSVWRPPPSDWVLLSDDVHVWSAFLNQSASRIHNLAQRLSADERARADRFYFQRDKNRFIVGRGLLRTILSCYLGIVPNQLQFYYGPHGKPALAETLSRSILRFNLSHSQELVLYAVTRDREIGIDLEYIRPIAELEQIVERFFSVREKALFRALPPNERAAAFFNCWTCKEAFLKAIGDGLAFPMEQLDVSLSPNEPAQLLGIRGSRFDISNWSLQELKPAPGYVAALAVEGHKWRLACWQWSEEVGEEAPDGANP